MMSSSVAMTPPKSSGLRERLKRAVDWLEYKDKEEWVKDMKESLSLTATIIATMTFQIATNPPGGVVQGGLNDKERCSISKINGRKICIGQSILAVLKKDTYLAFLVSNTVCFLASLCVCLLLVSGIPLNRKFPIWLLSLVMCITISSLALTYLFAASMVTPTSIWPSSADNGFGIALVVWVSLAAIVGAFHILRFFLRGVIKWFL